MKKLRISTIERSNLFGCKTSIKTALDIAIDVLEGKELTQIPACRPRLARKLRKARMTLLKEKVIWQ